MSSWPNKYGEGYTIHTGSYGGIDDRYKSRKKKHPIGFVQPRPKLAPKRKPK